MTILSRDELHELTWSEPIKTLAAKYDVSDVWLRKQIISMDVPVPGRGYWAKIKAGKPALKARLPVRGPGMAQFISLGRAAHDWPYDPNAILAEPPASPPVFTEPMDAVEARVRQKVGNVAMIRSLAAPHKDIAKLLAADAKRLAEPKTSPYLITWYPPLFESAFEKRRLKLINSLFAALTRFGAWPHLAGATAREISVGVGQARVPFRLDHPSAKADSSGVWRVRSGWADVLQLTISGPEPVERWVDNEDTGLEAHLADIVVALIVEGERSCRLDAQRRYEWRMERRQEAQDTLLRRQREQEQALRAARIKAEHEARAELLKQAHALRDAEEIRYLVAAARARVGAQLDEVAALEAWSAWALGVADRLDPVQNIAMEGDRLRLGVTPSDDLMPVVR